MEVAGGVVVELSAGGVVAGAGSDDGAGEDDGSGLLVSDGVVLHAPSRATHIPSAIKPPAWSNGFFMLVFLFWWIAGELLLFFRLGFVGRSRRFAACLVRIGRRGRGLA
ncbi:MAG TPA: hypothetical protein VN017_02905, partial [Pseudoxanthomonas sp.]|nr:hypothetical protein [Pseudoxanthomonas sp.]